MFIVTASLEIGAQDRGKFLDLMVPVVAETLEEPGCLDYWVCADPSSDTRVRVFERWESSETLAAHLASEHTLATRRAMGELEIISPPASRRFDISAEHDDIFGGEPVGGGEA